MNKATHHFPLRRQRQLITKEVDGELLVYDRENDRVHCLNATAAFVWKHSDGQTSVATMAQLLKDDNEASVEEEIVLDALAQLNKSNLLDDSYAVIAPQQILSRRAIMRLGAAAALITSIAVPAAAQAATCLPSGAMCASDSSCCSGSCVDNGRGEFQCA